MRIADSQARRQPGRAACDQARGLAADSIADLGACTLVETAVGCAGRCYLGGAADPAGNCTEQVEAALLAPASFGVGDSIAGPCGHRPNVTKNSWSPFTRFSRNMLE